MSINTTRNCVCDIITGRIITLLEQGTVPWHKPWKVQTGLPRNLVSKKPYRGINVFILHAMQYESPFWLTFHQAQQLGGNVRKGEKACPVVFWKQLEVKDKETGEKEKIPLLRYYHVFNLAQCEGFKQLPEAIPAHITPSLQIVENMPQRPEIKHGMKAAFYSPREDIVGMPSRERFESEAGYFGTLFHELIHNAATRIMPRRAFPVLGTLGLPARRCGIIRELPERREVCRPAESGLACWFWDSCV